MIHAAVRIAPDSPANQDRAAAITAGERLVLVLADGAGGVGNGARAAEFLIEFVRNRAQGLELHAVKSLLLAADQAMKRNLQSGETTAIVAVVSDGVVGGASVGDSAAWMVSSDHVTDLTAQQLRRPLLGTGEADVVSFVPRPIVGRLVLGSDGLIKYVRRDRLIALASQGTIEESANALAEAPRLRSGAFPDDVSIIVCGEDGSDF